MMRDNDNTNTISRKMMVDSSSLLLASPPNTIANYPCFVFESQIEDSSTMGAVVDPFTKSKPRNEDDASLSSSSSSPRSFVQHNYNDHSNDPYVYDCENNEYTKEAACSLATSSSRSGKKQRRGPRGGVTEPFPMKLYEMLSQVEIDDVTDIVNWQPHGRCFIIHQPKKFVEIVMPKYFKQSKFTSFQRQVNLYGFRRITKGTDRGGYYHELFLRGRQDLCKCMIRTRIKGTGTKAMSSPLTEPNFYTMKPCFYNTNPKNSSTDTTSNSSNITIPKNENKNSNGNNNDNNNYNILPITKGNSTDNNSRVVVQDFRNGNINTKNNSMNPERTNHGTISLASMVPAMVPSMISSNSSNAGCSSFSSSLNCGAGPLPCPSRLPTCDDVINEIEREGAGVFDDMNDNNNNNYYQNIIPSSFSNNYDATNNNYLHHLSTSTSVPEQQQPLATTHTDFWLDAVAPAEIEETTTFSSNAYDVPQDANTDTALSDEQLRDEIEYLGSIAMDDLGYIF